MQGGQCHALRCRVVPGRYGETAGQQRRRVGPREAGLREPKTEQGCGVKVGRRKSETYALGQRFASVFISWHT